MNQQYNSIISIIIYNVTRYVINKNIFRPMFKPILYIIKNKFTEGLVLHLYKL